MIELSPKTRHVCCGAILRARHHAAGRSVLAALVLLIVFASDAAAQGYGGPSILSRGGNRPGRRGRAPIDFTFYAGARGTAEQGLVAPILENDGVLRGKTAYGYSTEVGLYGAHDWSRTSLGVDYRGDYRHNNVQPYFNGFNHAVSLDLQHQLGRHSAILLRQTGGQTNRAFGGFSAPAFAELNSPGIPLNEVFDVRTRFLQSSAAISHRRSARMTLQGEVGGFVISRASRALVNVQGYMASGAIGYRATRRTEWLGTYRFMRMEFRRAYAGSDAHGVSFGVRRQFTRQFEVEVTAGAFRIDSFATQTVQLSPEVAFILGRSTGTAEVTRLKTAPLVEARATYLQERGRFTAGYTRGIGPGNGVYLTTSQESINGGYSYTGLRRMSIGISGGYTRYGSVALDLADFENMQGGLAFSYRLMSHLDFSSQVDYRKFNAPALQGREGFAATIGLTYTPSRFPLSIW